MASLSVRKWLYGSLGVSAFISAQYAVDTQNSDQDSGDDEDSDGDPEDASDGDELDADEGEGMLSAESGSSGSGGSEQDALETDSDD